MLKQRIIFGVLGVIAAIAIIFFASVQVIGVCIAIIAALGLWEFYRVTGLFSKKSPSVFLGYTYAAFLYVYTILTGSVNSYVFLLSVLIYVFLLLTLTVMFHDKMSFNEAAVSFLGTVYIAVFFLHIVLIRALNSGKLLIWILFICAWATDTFAYIFGKTMGKHKLCPKISPKKTVEGSLGGILGCMLCVFVYTLAVSGICGFGANYASALAAAALGALFSQVGDLAASCIKREHGAKDYSNLIPGHGGILDRFDSVLFISPLIYYILAHFPIFM